MTHSITTAPARGQQPTTTFTNAQEMHRLHPDTFDAPSEDELAAIRPGDSVKVCTGGERFWVTVTQAGEAELTGTVDNDLVLTADHGLRYRDAVRFPRECVYSVWSAAETAA